jgi:hypothetical protein
MHIRANQGQSHAGLWCHGKALEYPDMAMATTHQNNVAGDGVNGWIHKWEVEMK